MTCAPANPLTDAHAKPWTIGRDAMVRELMKPLAPFLDIPGATEVIINRPFQVFVETDAQWTLFDSLELSFERLCRLAGSIANFTDQEIGPRNPILSAVLPDGQRVQIIMPPAVEPETISFSIRLPSKVLRGLESYKADGAFDRFIWPVPSGLDTYGSELSEADTALIDRLLARDLASFIIQAVQVGKNVAVVGGTGSGKTTLMQSMCQAIPHGERLITIEDVRELHLPHHPNKVHLLYARAGQGVADVSVSDLIASTMRMKPNRVLIAELRGHEAFDFLKLLTTGHSGSVTSFHAESCALALERYVFMCREHPEAAAFDPIALKRLVALTIDVIVHVRAVATAGSKLRFVSEVHFDPIAKLHHRFGSAPLVKGRSW